MIIIFHPTYSSSGSSVVGAHPASSGHRQDSTLDRVPLHHGVIHTPTLLKWGQCRQASHLYRKSLECGRNPEKTHADMGMICQLHTPVAPARNRLFSQHYNERAMKETVLFQTPFYCN